MGKTTNKTQKHYESARKEALKYVELQARKILAEDKSLKEFIMGMGTYFFMGKNDTVVGNYSIVNYEYTLLDEFIKEWDSRLGITGEPMRFTAEGKVVTNW